MSGQQMNWCHCDDKCPCDKAFKSLEFKLEIAREALEKIAETPDTGGAERYFGNTARDALSKIKEK